MTSSHRSDCTTVIRHSACCFLRAASGYVNAFNLTQRVILQDDGSMHGSDGYEHVWDEAAERPGLSAQVSRGAYCTLTMHTPSLQLCAVRLNI